MSYILLFLLFGSTVLIVAETPSQFDRIKERLQSSAKELSITELSKPPKASFYLNSELTKNAPHQINLTKEITKTVREWTPRLLALDPACPYYFSKYNNISSPDDDLNLLSYLQAIESNETLTYPYVNILSESYRSAIPLLSIFRCHEFVSSKSNSFFHNIELIVGPGKSELPLERQSNQFSQFYCSLYGQPHFLLINQTKQPTITYNAVTLLSQDDLTDIDFLLTSLAPGTCLFVPSDWVIGAQLNNSISLSFTLKKIPNPADDESLPCTKTGETTLETVQFVIEDPVNITAIRLMVYFYQYLNPPTFDQEYTNEIFFDFFRADKNISQLVLKWTPELIDLIKTKLFQQLDINHDQIFNIADYFDIKQLNINQLQLTILEILEEIRQIVLVQYNELNDILKKIIRQSGNYELDEDEEENLEILIQNLPDPVQEKFRKNNIDIKDVLNIIRSKKSKRSSTNKQRIKKDEQNKLNTNQNQEKEITNENKFDRTDL